MAVPEASVPERLPERGGIRVEFQQGTRSGSTGVVAAVVQLLTGAAGSSGFKGLHGRFNRAGLIRFSPDLLLMLRFTRLDTGDAVDASADLALVPADPALEPLLDKGVQGRASVEERRAFGEAWQRRVKQLLFDAAHDPAVYIVRPAGRRCVHAIEHHGVQRRSLRMPAAAQAPV